MAGETRDCCPRATRHLLVLPPFPTLSEAPVSAHTALGRNDIAVQTGIKTYPLICTGSSKNPSLFLTAQAQGERQKRPNLCEEREMPLYVKHQCRTAPRHLAAGALDHWCHGDNSSHRCQVFITTCVRLAAPHHFQRFLRL